MRIGKAYPISKGTNRTCYTAFKSIQVSPTLSINPKRTWLPARSTLTRSRLMTAMVRLAARVTHHRKSSIQLMSLKAEFTIEGHMHIIIDRAAFGQRIILIDHHHNIRSFQLRPSHRYVRPSPPCQIMSASCFEWTRSTYAERNSE
jgi:hypothetical protein